MIHLPLVASLAVAAPDAATCSLDLGLSAEAPLAAGVQGVVELPGRVRVAAGLGGVPGAFVSGASGIATATGLLEDSAAQALHDSLHGTRVLGVSVGWRPLERAGFWLAADYRKLRIDASAEATQIESAFSIDLGGVEADGKQVDGALGETSTDPFALSFRAHLLGGSVGHDWVLSDTVVLRLSAGALGMVGGSTRVEPGDDAPAVGPEQTAAEQAGLELDGLFEPRFLTPTRWDGGGLALRPRGLG